MRQKQLENSVKTTKEGQEIFDLKPLTEEETAYGFCQGVVCSKI